MTAQNQLTLESIFIISIPVSPVEIFPKHIISMFYLTFIHCLNKSDTEDILCTPFIVEFVW